MRKKVFSCIILCIVIILSYVYAHIDKNHYVYDKNADTSTYVGTNILLEGEFVKQSFVASDDTIDGINLKISVYGSPENLILQYTILDSDDVIVAEAEVSGTELQHNKFNQLQLPTIENTKGNLYTLMLGVKHADEQNALGFYIEPTAKGDQTLLVREQETEGALVTRITSHRFDVETFVVLLGIIVFITGFMKVLDKYFR